MMYKEIYLVGGREAETYPTFRDRMLGTASDVMQFYRPAKMWTTLTVAPPPRLSVIPFQRGKIAAFTLFRKEEEPKPCTLLTELDSFRSAYRVEEALPVSYLKNWQDGTITPGVCLLTLFRQRTGISREQFLDRWHNSHTPLSLRIHPLWHYNRNVVTSTLVHNDTAWDGVVEEHFKTRSQLLNPFRFFGHPLVIVPRMVEVYKDVNSFLDYKSIETWLVREYWQKSDAAH